MKLYFFNNVLKNKIVLYLGSGYLSYFAHFIISLVIAAKLGPYYMGIYGFITLIINYFAVVSFGIPSSLNVLVVHHKDDSKLCSDYINNSFWIYILLSFILLLITFFLWVFDIEISKSYPIHNYLFIVVFIAILNYINSVCNAVLRIRSKVNKLSLIQILGVILNILALLVADGENLIMALLLSILLSGIVTLIITKNSEALPPFKVESISLSVQKEILNKGTMLFFYNSCFSFILISIRSLVSANYEVEEFGAFTFSFSIANAVILLLDALMAILFPKVLDLLSSKDSIIVENTLDKLRGTYISSAHFLIYIAMLFFPLLLNYMSKYTHALTSMNLIALAVLMNTNSSGYSALLIAKNKEKISATLSLSALILNIIFGIFLIYVLHVSFSYVILATLMTYMFFSFMVVKEGKKTIGVTNVTETLRNFFPMRLFVPYVIALIISCLQLEYLIGLPLLLYIFINTKDIKMIYEMTKKMLENPNIIDLKKEWKNE